MAESKAVLKTYFENGDKPTEDEFSALIDAFVHVDDDLDLAIGSFAEVGEAEAGVVTDKYMNPFLTKKAINALTRLETIPELEAEVDLKLIDMAKRFYVDSVGPPPPYWLYELGDIVVHNSTNVYIRIATGYAFIG